jgi:FkbM family methyltransferase
MLIDFKTCSEIVSLISETHIENIYHIGAHEGQEIHSYAENGVKKIIWFEANPDVIEKLHENLSLYAIDNTIVPYALWNINTELDFHVTNFNQSSSFFEIRKHAEFYPQITVDKKIKVNAFRLDSLIEIQNSFLSWHNFNFINIDTQGAELAILEGIGNYLYSDSLKSIYLEVNNVELYKGIPMVNEIDTYLKKYNFVRVKTVWSDSGWGDALYVKPFTILPYKE